MIYSDYWIKGPVKIGDKVLLCRYQFKGIGDFMDEENAVLVGKVGKILSINKEKDNGLQTVKIDLGDDMVVTWSTANLRKVRKKYQT